MSDALKNENQNLKNQNEMLMAQIDAYRAVLNEQLQAGINLRTNLVILTKRLQDSDSKVKSLQTALDAANNQINELLPLKENKDNIEQLSKDLDAMKKIQENDNASNKKSKQQS